MVVVILKVAELGVGNTNNTNGNTSNTNNVGKTGNFNRSSGTDPDDNGTNRERSKTIRKNVTHEKHRHSCATSSFIRNVNNHETDRQP